jgi:Arc/MetJ family transcription regulator
MYNIIRRTTIELDPKLVEEAMRLTGIKTKKELVNYALRELVRWLKREEVEKKA